MPARLARARVHSTSSAPPQPPRSAPAASRAPAASGDRAPTRVALVGAGFIADFHAQILARTPGVELVAICDADLERARSLARRRAPNARALQRIEELAPAGVELAHVLAPPPQHAPLARALLEAGLGVFCEKPLALSSSEARELGALARERGLPLGVNHNALHQPTFVRLRRELEGGALGRLEHVQLTLSVPLRQLDAGDFAHWMFREERNILFEQAVHPFAQLHALLGRVRELDARRLATRELLPGQHFSERWLISARAERGTAEVYLAFGTSFAASGLRALCSDGSCEADLLHGTLSSEHKTLWLDFWNSFLAAHRRGGALRRDARAGLRDYVAQTVLRAARRDAFWVGMRDSIHAFHAALRAGAAPPSGAEDAAEVLAWCERAADPARSSAVAQAAQASSAPAPSVARASASVASSTPRAPRTGEILVLGATGFIGRRVLARLLARGAPVSVLARRMQALPEPLASAARSGEVRLFQGALSAAHEQRDALRRALEGASGVLHLATGGGASWEDIERSMIAGSRALAETCAEAGVRRLVYVSSTAALYLGRDCGSRVIEDDVGTDPRPAERALYARGKIAAEAALREVADARSLGLVITRPGVVLGPGTPMQHSGLGLWVRDNHCVGWGRGERPLPLVLADDVAEALALVALHRGSELNGRALNLASCVPINAREMVEAFARASGRALHFHPRALGASQAMEIGKWLVKRAGGQGDAPFPPWRDLKSRELWPALSARTARVLLGWQPVEERDAFLAGACAGLGRE